MWDWLRRVLYRGGLTTMRPSDPLAYTLFTANATSAGVSVTERTALTCSAYWSGIRLLSESLAVLPLRQYEEKRREIVEVNDDITALCEQPCPACTGYTFYQTGMYHLTTKGNVYAEILRRGDGTPAELWLMDPDDTEPQWAASGREVEYVSRSTGRKWRQDQIVHVPGLGFDGLKGYNLLDVAKQAIGLALGAENYGAQWFGSGGRPSGLLKHPGKLSDEAVEKTKADWNKIHEPGSHRIAMLREGVDFMPFENDPEKSQALATRRMQVAEVARFLRIPPHMLFDLDRSTFSNVEQMSQEFLTYSLGSWLVSWEQALAWKLLTPLQRRTRFLRFDVNELLRGDSLKRAQKNVLEVNAGLVTAAEVRRDENRPYIEGTDKLRVPLNYAAINENGDITNNGEGQSNGNGTGT